MLQLKSSHRKSEGSPFLTSESVDRFPSQLPVPSEPGPCPERATSLPQASQLPILQQARSPSRVSQLPVPSASGSCFLRSHPSPLPPSIRGDHGSWSRAPSHSISPGSPAVGRQAASLKVTSSGSLGLTPEVGPPSN